MGLITTRKHSKSLANLENHQPVPPKSALSAQSQPRIVTLHKDRHLLFSAQVGRHSENWHPVPSRVPCLPKVRLRIVTLRGCYILSQPRSGDILRIGIQSPESALSAQSQAEDRHSSRGSSIFSSQPRSGEHSENRHPFCPETTGLTTSSQSPMSALFAQSRGRGSSL